MKLFFLPLVFILSACTIPDPKKSVHSDVIKSKITITSTKEIKNTITDFYNNTFSDVKTFNTNESIYIKSYFDNCAIVKKKCNIMAKYRIKHLDSGYSYFEEKFTVSHNENFIHYFKIPATTIKSGKYIIEVNFMDFNKNYPFTLHTQFEILSNN